MSDLVEASHDKAERAYAIWSTDGDCDVEKTAQLCGIPARTLYYYRRRDHWDGRLERERLANTAEAVLLAANMVRAGMPHVVESMQMICYGTKPLINADGRVVINPDTGKAVMIPMSHDKDRVAAGRWLLQFGFISATEVLRDEQEVPDPVTTYSCSAGDAGRPRSAREEARDILNANYAMANTRRSPGKRR